MFSEKKKSGIKTGGSPAAFENEIRFNENPQTEHPAISRDADELRGRFTAWLKTVISHAKIDYIRRRKDQRAEVSFEEEGITDALVCGLEDLPAVTKKTAFDFDGERIRIAFSKLPPKRAQVLTMVFVQNLTLPEIADSLHLTVEHIYNQQSLALKELKRILSGEGKQL